MSSYWSNWAGLVRLETLFQCFIFFTALLISEIYSPNTIFRVLRDVALLCVVLVFISLILSPSSNLSSFVAIYHHKNTTGQFLGLCTIILLFSKDVLRFKKIFILLSLSLLLLTNSTTSIIAFILAISAGYLTISITDSTRAWLHFTLSRVGYWALLFLFIQIYIFHIDILDFIYNNLSDEAITGRGILWKTMLYHAEEKIVMGFGYASVWWHDDYSEIYFTDLARTNLNWVEKLSGSDGGFVDVVLSLGLIGLFMFITFLYTILLNLLKMDDRNQRSILISLFCLITTFGITESIFLVPQNAFWFFLLLIFCMSIPIKNKNNYVC
ncbi:O-antigen ligase family protein [Colwellia echini]|nr:O-antigen ligase family protein [Colwellia echini]